MKFLVAYASKYGATAEIAERIAAILCSTGHDAEALAVKDVRSLDEYDAFVIGSAVYFGSWQKDAVEFIETNGTALRARPLWLFSSGPIGLETLDDEGRDIREAAEPKQIAGFRERHEPRDHQVFYGKLERRKLGLRDKVVTSMPAFPGSEGDFRDWSAIEAWARSIAHAVEPIESNSCGRRS